MKKRLKNFTLAGIIISTLTFVFCAWYEAPEYYLIDAVTSASNEIRVDSGKAYYNRTILNTYKKDSYIDHFVTYGINNSTKDTVYSDTVILASFPRNIPCTLSNLLPNTNYNYMFIGYLPSNPKKEIHGVMGGFTTPRKPQESFPSQ